MIYKPSGKAQPRAMGLAALLVPQLSLQPAVMCQLRANPASSKRKMAGGDGSPPDPPQARERVVLFPPALLRLHRRMPSWRAHPGHHRTKAARHQADLLGCRCIRHLQAQLKPKANDLPSAWPQQEKNSTVKHYELQSV